MAPTDVLKPDHSRTRRHFIFTDEHEQLRESIRRFVINELQPHADEWEETTFPNWVFTRMGELGFLGLDKPVEYGGQGGDYYSSLVLSEEIVHSPQRRPVDGRRGAHGHGAAADPRVRDRGAEAQWAAPAIAGKKILCIGITEPDAGSDVAGIKTRAVRDGDEYVINGSKTVHHQRPPGRRDRARDEDRPRGRLRRLHAVPGADGPSRRDPREELEKLGMHSSDTALLAFQDVRVPDTAVLGEIGKGFYHIMWELQGERLIGAAGSIAGAQHVFDRTLQYAKERNRVRARRSAASR